MALNSETTIKLVDLLCEGPIEGLIKNRESVFLDETSALDKEVESIDFSFRSGTGRQAPFDDHWSTCRRDNKPDMLYKNVQGAICRQKNR